MTRHHLVPPQRLKPVAGAVVRLALDRAPVAPAVKMRGAGIAYVDPDGRALFLKRGAGGDHAGEWCFPGGGIEDGETPEAAAVRESREECGANPYGARSLMAETAMDGVHFTTYAQPVKHAFTPRLNEEHTEHVWAPLATPPEPLHPGVRQALSGMAMDADWVEADHPRADNGQFGKGGGAMSPAVSAKAATEIHAPAPAGYPPQLPALTAKPAGERTREQPGPSAATAPKTHAAPPGPTPTLDTHARAIESRLADKLGMKHVGFDEKGNSQFKLVDRAAMARAVAEYGTLADSDGGKILNTDVARELSPDYLKDRTLSAAVHEPASQFIKELYAQKLAEKPGPGEDPMVFFTAGGTGAGKTSAVNGLKMVSKLADQAQVIYDTNMNTYGSAKKKIEQALAAGKSVTIALVARDPEDALINGALPRAEGQRKKFGSGRTVPLHEHIGTHIGAIETVNRLAEEYGDHGDVHIKIIDNSLGRGKQEERSVEWLKSLAYNDVEQRVTAALERENEAGRISPETYRGFKGQEAQHAPAGGGGKDQGLQRQAGPGHGGEPAQGNSRAGEKGRLGQDHRPDIAAPSGAAAVSGLAQDDEHWITVNGGEGKGQPLLITGGGVVVGGAGGNLNGKTLSPKSKSAPRAGSTEAASKFADVQKSLQNRNRSSAASIAQMNRIASNPNPRLLMAAPTMNDGAPVVADLHGSGIAKLTGKRDVIVTGKREIPVRYAVVEADDLSSSNRADGTKNDGYAKDPSKLTAINNGRTAAVVEAYARGTADAYKTAIAKGERIHGIAGKDIKAMKAPVLVRIMDAADVTDSIGDESNAGQTLTLSAVEQAQNDSVRFDPSAIDYNDDGTPTDAAIRGFINAMPQAEQQSLAPNGKPTKQAIDRMMAATFHAAYGDTELVGLMAQATDPESRNLIGGMSRAAGAMAKLKDAGELDIRELVTGAAKQIINAVRSGVSIKKFLKQGDLLTDSAEDQIAALFAENSRSAKAIGERLSAAAAFAFEESQKGGEDIFGDPVPQASRRDVLENLHAQS